MTVGTKPIKKKVRIRKEVDAKSTGKKKKNEKNNFEASVKYKRNSNFEFNLRIENEETENKKKSIWSIIKKIFWWFTFLQPFDIF